MHNEDGQWIGLGVGDEDAEVLRVRDFLRNKFKSYASHLPDSITYDEGLAAVVAEMQGRYGLEPTGIWDWKTKTRAGYLAPKQAPRPVIFGIEGHMADPRIGPCSHVAWVLENEHVARWRATIYDNRSLPFNNQSGVDALDRHFSDTAAFPVGTPWGAACHSQGGIVFCEFFLRHVRPVHGKHHNRLADMVGVLAFGNPYREVGVVAPWVADPPKPNTGGISDRRMTDTPANWAEVARKGDLYTDNDPTTHAGEHKTAIYKMVQREFTGKDSIVEQLLEIGLNPTVESVNVALAIIHGVTFLFNMDKHGVYDMEPCFQFMRDRFRNHTTIAA